MKEQSVQVNDILQIRTTDDQESLPLNSRVEDVLPDVLVIAWPVERGRPAPVRLGQQVSLSFVRGGLAYVFAGAIKEQGQQPIPYLKIRPLGPPQKVQRRDYFRVKMALDLELAGVVGYPASREAALYLNTHTYDLSGGGMSIRTEKSIPPGSMVEAKLNLPDNLPPMKLTVRIVSSIPILGTDGRPLTHTGMSFRGMKESERRRLIRFLTQAQRTQLT
jgi:c-di-GMP-binding flagellar brake protein YcgR